MIAIAISLISSFHPLFADESYVAKSPLQMMLEQDAKVRTREIQVEVDGVRYHKIEAEGKAYYLTTLVRDGDVPMLLCELGEGFRSPRMVEASLKLRKRKRFFLQALTERCSTRDPKTGQRVGGRAMWVEIAPVIGIHIPDSDDSLIKNGKLGLGLHKLIKEVAPSGQGLLLPDVIFSGEFE